jgi:hypothetical protein
MSSQLERDRIAYANGYYEKKHRIGLEFQDLVTRALCQRGIVLLQFVSQRYQYEYGENLFGAEIKRDSYFRETGNLYIETAEKSHPNVATFTPSGIFCNNNSWLYIIGDEASAWVFAVRDLRYLYHTERTRSWRKEKTTSQGYVLPLLEADRLRLFRFSPNGKEADAYDIPA